MPEDNSIYRILIVDDLAENIEILGTVLRKNGYKVAVALNGEGAIEIAKSIKPDLILLDISMPGMDGFTVCSILKKDENTSGIPVIFLSASNEVEDVVTGLSLGAVDYITKPFKQSELLIRLKTHLTIKRLQSELEEANETLEKKVEERTRELQAAKEKAESSDRLKSEFLSQISHEIRTPLNAVISSASLIESEFTDKADDSFRPLFNNIKNGTKRIIRTVDLILNMSQVHTNSYTPIYERLNLSEVLRQAVLKYTPPAAEKLLSVEHNIPADAYIIADEHALSEIFEQLLDNAVNYTHNGKICVALNDEGSNYSVIIEDTGVGIAPEYIPNLFNYFSQEEGGYSRRFEGNGLGLALAKKFCDINSASIELDSIKNEGTKITIRFPKHKEN